MRNRQGLLWDLTKGRPLGEPIPSSGSPQDVHFSPDGQRVVVAFMEGSARVYDANSGRPLSERLIHQDVVTAARFSPEGRRILTASSDKTARLWEAVPRPKPAVILGDFGDESNFNAPVQFSPDGQRVVTGAGRLQVWDAHSGLSLAKSDKTNDYNSVSYSPDGRLLLIRSRDDLCVLDAQTLEPLTEPIRFGETRESRFNSDGTEVVA